MKTTTIFLSVTALLFCDAAVCAQSKVQDVLLTRNGRRIRGVEVTSMTSSTIQYLHGNDALELPANLLAEVQWSEPPEGLAIGRAAERSGNFQAAADAFREAADATKRDPLKAECGFLSADALLRAAGSDQQKAAFASEKLTAWITAYPDGYRLPDATLALGRALLAAGKSEQAELTLKKLADDALARNWSPIWGARAKFVQARAQLARNDLGNARSSFRAAMSAAQSAATGDQPDPELVTLEAEASVGIGETMVKEGKFDDALTYFKDLARRATSDTVRAAARAGEGEALYLRAKDTSSVAELRAAQIALAEANLLDTSAGEATAKALYYSGMVLLALGPDNESSTFRQRALDYFATVIKEYSATSWASAAAEASRN